jgi:LCP family protein required for cell wall assembly
VTDERHDGEEAPEDEHRPEDDGGVEAPPPATWAGRQGWSGAETGLTEEFDEVEQELAEDLDTELAGEYAAPDDAHADEGPDPADEFDFEDLEEAEDADDGGETDAEEAEEAERAEKPEEAEETVADEPAEDAGGASATVEADTVVLADQEEAREAAMQGLRDRTAEHAAKRGVTDPGHAPEAETAEPEDAEAEQGEPEEEKTAVAAAVGAGAGAPPEGEEAEEKPPRAGVWARFLAASFLIIASMAAATSVSLLVYLTDIAKGLGGLDLANQLDEIDEEAQNFLIIGSDVRPDQSSKGLSDTTILLRVDPDRGAITQLSIPRDLRVNIPGHGVDKFNAAYSYGGPKLTLEVVKQITGDRIPINHVVNVDFNGFADAVDAIGCVYVDVDRHYFNDNSTAASFADQYAEINIEAGYQRLCGFKALQYVRYRHEDNDIVRAARQQGFLREARQKVPPDKLLDERNKLLDIFTDYTTSDINDSGTLVELFKLMLDARDAQITQIEFPYDSLDEEGYVTASDEPLRKAVDEFMGVGSEPEDEDAGGGGGDKAGGGKPDKKPESKPDEPERTPEQIAAAEMIDTTVAGQQYAAAIRDQGGKDLKFPVLYPTLITPGSTISDDTRYFKIDAGDGKAYNGYKFVISRPGTSYPTAYYGVSGTDWLDAPLFENPSTTRKIDEREYLFYYDGPALRMLAFERDKTMYWVTNTLDKLLTEPQMIAIAQNLGEAGT